MKKFAAILLCMLVVFGCDGLARRRNAFVENNDIRLQIGGTVQFRYDPLTCQLSFSRDRLEFRAQTDNTSDYYSVVFSEIPFQLWQTVSADLTWTTETDILTRKNLTLEVIKVEGENVWLWSDSGRIGLSIRLLE